MHLMRLGLVANPEDAVLRAKVSATLFELGQLLGEAAKTEGIPPEVLDRMLRGTEAGAPRAIERGKLSPWVGNGGERSCGITGIPVYVSPGSRRPSDRSTCAAVEPRRRPDASRARVHRAQSIAVRRGRRKRHR